MISLKDWDYAWDASFIGELWQYLQVVPREQWTYLGEHDRSYLHIICLCPKSTQDSTKAMMIQLIDQGVNPYLLDKHGRNVAHYLAAYGCDILLEVLCAIDVKLMKEKNLSGETVLDVAISCGSPSCIRILVANGYRLHGLKPSSVIILSNSMYTFDKGVQECRDVIVTLLGLKKFRRPFKLNKLDRFLVKQVLAVEIWTTRKKQVWM